MVTIEGRYEGDLRCTLRHPSGSQLDTDAPKDNEGRGEAFSPTDLVATAFASCAMTIMGIVARREGLPIEGMTARVVKKMSTDPRRIGQLALEIVVPGQLDAVQRQRLENAAHACPVAKSLHPDILAQSPVRFVYPDCEGS